MSVFTESQFPAAAWQPTKQLPQETLYNSHEKLIANGELNLSSSCTQVLSDGNHGNRINMISAEMAGI